MQIADFGNADYQSTFEGIAEWSIKFDRQEMATNGYFAPVQSLSLEQLILSILLIFDSGTIFRDLGSFRLQDNRDCWPIVSFSVATLL